MNRNHDDALADAVAQADAINLQQIDHARAVARPEGVGTFHSEREYAANGEVQVETYTADGEAAARPQLVNAAGLELAATTAGALISGTALSVEDARERKEHAERTLGHLARRDSFAKLRYLLAWIILGLGDTAGILGAAISLGEIPYIALGQALATGFAAVASGQAGAELKDLMRARQRQRDLDDLTEDERRYRVFFMGMEAGVSIMKLVGCLSATIVVIISIGIFSLRLSVEGLTSGIAFGALAAATALGSFITTYSYTDEIADFINRTKHAYEAAVADQLKLAAHPAIKQHAEALTAAGSIKTEHAHRGQAALWQLHALSQRVLRQNPGVAGHGVKADQPEVIGRRFRGDAA